MINALYWVSVDEFGLSLIVAKLSGEMILWL
jgi:hypothetical protein